MNVRKRWRMRFGAAALTLIVAGSAGLNTASAAGADTNANANATPNAGSPSPMDGNGMWIWEAQNTEGGDVAKMVDRAKKNNVNTVFVKSGDGGKAWDQLTPELVKSFHDAGIKVVGWQYVYGNRPYEEAVVGATAKDKGADGFVIDAEVEYEGKYKQAQVYTQELRKRVGNDFPIGFSSFPYVDNHSSLPYSVFLGPGGATSHLPQMYWKEIGTDVDTVFARTYNHMGMYGTPVYPLGQLHDNAARPDVTHFRALAKAHGATGVNWWDWQHASTPGFVASGDGEADKQPVASVTTQLKTYGKGSNSDVIVSAQQRLITAGQNVKVDGEFGSQTENAVKAFQKANGLGETGTLNNPTWKALVKNAPAPVQWTDGGAVPQR